MEKKITKTRKFSKTYIRAYQLGCLNTEVDIKKTLNALRATNKALWEELARLDKENPKGGVLLDYDTAEQVVRAARKARNYYLTGKIRKAIKRGRARDDHAAIMAMGELTSNI